MPQSLHRLAAALLTAACLMVTQPAQAQTFESRGRSLNLASPLGFCMLGSSQSEQALTEFQQRNTKAAGELAHLIVPCSELKEFRSGRRENFSRWMQILVLTPNGKQPVIKEDRATFVRTVASTFGKKNQDLDALNAKVQKGLDENRGNGPTVRMRAASVAFLEASPDAVFAAATVEGTVDAASTGTVAAVMATTVVNQLPVTLYGYGTMADLRSGQTLSLTKSYLAAVLAAN